jgi:hypothetical protein
VVHRTAVLLCASMCELQHALCGQLHCCNARIVQSQPVLLPVYCGVSCRLCCCLCHSVPAACATCHANRPTVGCMLRLRAVCCIALSRASQVPRQGCSTAAASSLPHLAVWQIRPPQCWPYVPQGGDIPSPGAAGVLRQEPRDERGGGRVPAASDGEGVRPGGGECAHGHLPRPPPPGHGAALLGG